MDTSQCKVRQALSGCSHNRSEVGLQLFFPRPLLACAHIALAPPLLEHGYLLYIRHHIATRRTDCIYVVVKFPHSCSTI